MPIAAALTPLQSQIDAAQNAGVAGSPSLTSTQIATALASAVPMGIIMLGPTPTPLVPAGFSATQSLLQAAFNMGVAGTPSSVAQMIASAISVMAPLAPPIGLSALQSMIQAIFNLGLAGSSSTTAQMLATAIVTYYTSGAVL